MARYKLAKRAGSLYLNRKILANVREIRKYGMPCIELALLRRTGNVAVSLELLGEARVMMRRLPKTVYGVSFLEGSSLSESRRRFRHHVLPLVDARGKRHELDLVKFGKTVYGIFVDGRIVATNGMAREPKRLVREIMRLAGGKRLRALEVGMLNAMLAEVAGMASSRDYIALTVGKG
jgi:hypothetical protein